MSIVLRTLGTLSLHVGGVAVDSLPAQRLRCALLVHLAVSRETTREAAMAMLWPERDADRARHSLSQVLYELRQDLPEGWLDARGDLLRVTDAVQVDALLMEEEVEEGRLDAAVERYRGHFLEATYLADTPGFQTWVDGRRAHFARVHRDARRRLVERSLARSDLAAAVSAARGWADIDPLDDEAQHRLIELLARAGERSQAIARYDAYERLLAAEDLEPLDDTRELISRVRAGAAVGGVAPASGPPPAAVSDDDAPARPPVASTPPATSGPASTSLLGELKRRQVFRVALAYAMASFLLVQAAETIFPRMGLPDWTVNLVLALALLGFPLAVMLAWIFDITPEGVRRTPGGRSRGPSWAPLFALLGAGVLIVGFLTLRSNRAASAPVALDPHRVAVLPIEDLSPDAGGEQLAQQLTGQLIQHLDRVDPLTVLPLGSVRLYLNTELPPDSVARALNVGLLVTGSVAVTSDGVRSNLQVLDGETGTQIRPIQVQSRTRERLRLVDELSAAASDTIRIAIGRWIELRRRQEETDSERAAGLVELAEQAWQEADMYRAYGNVSGGRAAYEQLVRADSLLRAAQRADRDWRAPLLMRGWVAADQARLVEITTDPVDDSLYVERARGGLAPVEELLERNPDDPEALELRGALRYGMARRLMGDRRGREMMELAARDLERAQELDPWRARALQTLSEIYQLLGDLTRARHYARRALDADAFLEQADAVQYRLFNSALYNGEFDRALADCREGQRRFPENPRFLMCELILRAFAEVLPADVDSARALVKRERALRADREINERVPRQLLELAGVFERAGMADSARSSMAAARNAARGLPGVATEIKYYEAVLYLRMGEPDSAVAMLRVLLEGRPNVPEYLKRDPWLAPLQSHPEFRRLMGGLEGGG